MNRIIGLLYLISSIKWQIIYWKRYLFSASFRNSQKKNIILNESHEGQRCFIVGNGPSLKEMDLGLLKDETVFTVNHLMKNPDLFTLIKPTYHVLVDPYFGKMSPKEKEYVLGFLEKMNVTLLLSYEVSEDLALGNRNLSYFAFYMHDNWNRTGRKRINLTENTFATENVVQAAICMAIYMGFKEINLIGCEFTGIYESFEYNANNNLINKHAYDIEDKEQFINSLSHDDNCKMLGEYYRVFTIFKNIKEYADNHLVQINNATIGGILDVFPRKDYRDLFKNNRDEENKIYRCI